MKEKVEPQQIVKMFCGHYVASRGCLCGIMPEGQTEPQAPYCLLPESWKDYKRDPQITEVQSCKGKKCDLKEALGLTE
jgi:hypothetical protein